MRVPVNFAKTAVLHQLGQASNEEEINLLADVVKSFAAPYRVVVLVVLVGSDAYVKRCAQEAIRERGDRTPCPVTGSYPWQAGSYMDYD